MRHAKRPAPHPNIKSLLQPVSIDFVDVFHVCSQNRAGVGMIGIAKLQRLRRNDDPLSESMHTKCAPFAVILPGEFCQILQMLCQDNTSAAVYVVVLPCQR